MSHVMRCKLHLTKCTVFAPAGKEVKPEEITGCTISMGAVYGTEKERENSVFGKYTPMGSFEATILNVTVARQLCALPLGTEMYVDFSIAPKDEAPAA